MGGPAPTGLGFDGALTYIPDMLRMRKKPPADAPDRPPQTSWAIYRIKSTPAERLGVVHAPDADAAIRRAIEVFGIADPQRQQRLMARRIG